jgi:electron transfer flavoprotein alpha subunit
VKDHTGVMVFAEQSESQIHHVSFELLGKGKELADRLGVPLYSVLLGGQVEEATRELIYYGAETVWVFDHPVLKHFDLLNYKHNIVKLIKEVKPKIFLLGATHLGRSLGPRIAAALDTGLTADCTGLDVDEQGNLIQIRPAFSGSILAQIKTKTRPQMATVRYKVMQSNRRDTNRTGEIVDRKPEIVPSLLSIVHREKSGEGNIVESEIIVSGGRGLKKATDFELLAELADLLGGAVGSSRPLVDDKWIGKEHQVGFSGHTIKPKVYIACGISGSPQHLAGMRFSDVIVAINTDPSAPIFKIADYGVIGDLYEVVPKLINRIRGKNQ